MNDFWEVVLPIVLIMALLLCPVFLIGFGVYKYQVEVAQANIIQVVVDDNVVYEGKKAFVAIESGGMTTTVKVYKKLFPFEILDKIYSQNNIKIVNK